MEVFECNLLQFNMIRRHLKRRRVDEMAPRLFAERTLLDDFAESEALWKFRLTKKLNLMLYVRLWLVLETTTLQNHAIPGMMKLLAVLHFLGKASYHMVACDFAGMSQTSFSKIFE